MAGEQVTRRTILQAQGGPRCRRREEHPAGVGGPRCRPGEDHAADAGGPAAADTGEPHCCRREDQLQTRRDLPSPAAALGSGLPLETGLLPSGHPSICPRESRPHGGQDQASPQTRPASQCLPPDPRPPRAVPRPCRDLVVGSPCQSTSLKYKCKLNAHIGYQSQRPCSARGQALH